MAVNYTKGKPSVEVVPVWTLATQEAEAPDLARGEQMTSQKLDQLRSALAAFASSPIATLEAHPSPKDLDEKRGIPLESASPLAKNLAQLVSSTPKARALDSGETLYRMVVPDNVASSITGPMRASAGGVYSALMGKSGGIAAHARFVPVVAGKSATMGAVGGSAATAGTAVAGAGVLTVAAPLVLMAVAVGVSAHAERKRQEAIARLETLLKKLDKANLDSERTDLNACVPAIEKATAVLLDRGRVGHSLGLDTAVHVIDKAMSQADSRLRDWLTALSQLPEGPKVELAKLREAIPGIDEPDSEFYAHLELADLAIALKRRVLVLQAVEHAQQDESNPFENFVDTLKADQRNLNRLTNDYSEFLQRLSALRLDRSHGIMDFTIGAGDVDKLLNTTATLRELPDRMPASQSRSDVAIEIVQKADGSLVVFPAYAVR
ncbi:MAG: hypothetical protein WAV90_14405 [Gordonia amarae]